MSESKVSRKDALNLLWVASGALVLGEAVFVGLQFLSPRSAEGEFGGVFNLGDPAQYPAGSVTPVETGRFYLIRLQDGGFIAIYRRCTHLGCAVPYEPTIGQFVCPCHGSQFSLDGDVLNQPAPRALDLFALSIENGEVLVDTGKTIERDHPDASHPVYA